MSNGRCQLNVQKRFSYLFLLFERKFTETKMNKLQTIVANVPRPHNSGKVVKTNVVPLVIQLKIANRRSTFRRKLNQRNCRIACNRVVLNIVQSINRLFFEQEFKTKKKRKYPSNRSVDEIKASRLCAELLLVTQNRKHSKSKHMLNMSNRFWCS
jgi:hypothetical protein